jgi:hypothetical protein
MSAAKPERIGFSVTVEVFVPVEVAGREVDRLDSSWHTESWTPEAAAYEVIREALAKSGLHRTASVRTTEVLG